MANDAKEISFWAGEWTDDTTSEGFLSISNQGWAKHQEASSIDVYG